MAKMFGITGGFLASLDSSWEYNVKADEIGFGVGTGKGSARALFRIAPFLLLAEFLGSIDNPLDAVASDGGLIGSLEINEKTVKGFEDIENQVTVMETVKWISFVNPGIDPDSKPRKVNLPYDAAVALFKPEILAGYEAMIEADDPRVAFLQTLVHEHAEATADAGPVDELTFRFSFVKNTRTIRVPMACWDDFRASIARAAEFVTGNITKYQGDDWRDDPYIADLAGFVTLLIEADIDES